MSTLDALDEATREYLAAQETLEKAQESVVKAVVAALQDGQRPTDVVDHSPFKAAYVRRLARQAGIEPAKPGPKSAHRSQ